jgi:dolichol-phosphate mannosyltransferase
LVVHHRARQHGHSKYGWLRIPKGFLDLLTVKFLTGYGQRPQHLLGLVGLFFFVVGGLGTAWLAAWWFISRMVGALDPIHLHQRAIFYYSIAAVLLGAQFTSIGLLAALLTAFQSQQTRSYSIADRVGPEAQRDHDE